jgi:hypothetical protein
MTSEAFEILSPSSPSADYPSTGRKLQKPVTSMVAGFSVLFYVSSVSKILLNSGLKVAHKLRTSCKLR